MPTLQLVSRFLLPSLHKNLVRGRVNDIPQQPEFWVNDIQDCRVHDQKKSSLQHVPIS